MSDLHYNRIGMLDSIKVNDVVYLHPETDRITTKKDERGIYVEISSDFDSPMISLLYEEIWIELKEGIT